MAWKGKQFDIETSDKKSSINIHRFFLRLSFYSQLPTTPNERKFATVHFHYTDKTDFSLFEMSGWSPPLFKTVEDKYYQLPSQYSHLAHMVWIKRRVHLEPEHKEEWIISFVQLSLDNKRLEMKERTCESVEKRNEVLNENGIYITDELTLKATLLIYKQIYTHNSGLSCCISSTLFPDGDLYNHGTLKGVQEEDIERLLEQLSVEKGLHAIVELMRRTDNESYEQLPTPTKQKKRNNPLAEQNEEELPSEKELLKIISSSEFKEASQFIRQTFSSKSPS